ncbi:MAG TPA: response regulator transcription factor [Acidobacteriota bacterium]|nr:response regulator transcription factor [Acidobacteriota bacterium]
MNRTIAVLDDEEDILELLKLHLKNAGFSVAAFSDPERLFAYLRSHAPDLLVLDLMLPGTDGMEVFRLLKASVAWSGIPVIMLTARAAEADRVLGLEMGADDYLTKPFSARELTARVRAVLRRAGETAGSAGRRTQIGDALVIDRDRREVIADGVRLDLTPAEFGILDALASSGGRVLSRDRLLDRLWGDTKVVTDRTIDVHIRNLRRKLGRMGNIIRNIRGAGYKLEP